MATMKFKVTNLAGETLAKFTKSTSRSNQQKAMDFAGECNQPVSVCLMHTRIAKAISK